MPDHTPGPWRHRPYYRGGFQITTQSGEVVPVEGYPQVGDEVKEANARLIAAAPDLLAALLEAVELFGIDFEVGDGTSNNIGGAWLAQARVAIAKATT